jgi:hypothetical protein
VVNNTHVTSVPLAPGVLRTVGLNQDKEDEGEETHNESIFFLCIIWFRYSDLSWIIWCDVIEFY